MRLWRKMGSFLVVLVLMNVVVGLEKVSGQQQDGGWLASFNTIKLGKKTSLHFDGQLRSSNDVNRLQTILLRPGLNYHLTDKLIATAGYALIEGRRQIGTVGGYATEHRAWQQLIYNQSFGGALVAHRFRAEQRWLGTPVAEGNNIRTEDFEEAFRLRYFIRAIQPIGKAPGTKFTQGWFAALQNEVFVNVGNKDLVNGKGFDQNRLYLAGGYRINKGVDVEMGYMNQYISGRNSSYVNFHLLQIAVYTRL